MSEAGVVAESGVSRRHFLQGAAGVSLAATSLGTVLAGRADALAGHSLTSAAAQKYPWTGVNVYGAKPPA